MAALPTLRTLSAPAWVRHEALNVAPALLGAPLAPHGRRLAAMAVDLAVVGALSTTGEFWIAAGIGALVWQLRHRPATRGWMRSAWLWGVLALLVFVGVQRGAQFVERQFGAPVTAGAARDDDGDDDAPAATRALAAAASAPGAALPLVALHEAQQRIARLEAELAEARRPQALRWGDQARRGLRAAGRGFGWAVAYFTLLPFWWKGQTVGKRLFGLRVVELTGRPLGLMASFGRYGGYAAAMATGGAGFAQVLWDDNRQAIQDKIAHTVVVDLRAVARTQPAPADAAPEALPPPADGAVAGLAAPARRETV